MNGINLEALLLRNFKIFKNFKMQFGKLTVLSGYNSTGKSTSYQPILLLSEAINYLSSNRAEKSMIWPLNGELLNLGTAGSVFNEDTTEKFMQFGFEFDNRQKLYFEFKPEKRKLHLTSQAILNNEKNLDLTKSISNVNFISAIRGGSDHLFPYQGYSNLTRSGVGTDGRFACFLYDEMEGRDEKFCEEVDYWLNQFVPGASAVVEAIPKISKLALYFKLSKASAPKTPANVGFGLSYAFPIVVALLTSKVNDLIIIDSPEAHLHPMAQSKMGKFIAKYASEGRQIVVETHSENFINGIRLAVKNQILSPEDLRTVFFSGADENSHGVINPVMDENGNLSDWPKGFFDQIETDLLELMEFE